MYFMSDKTVPFSVRCYSGPHIILQNGLLAACLSKRSVLISTVTSHSPRLILPSSNPYPTLPIPHPPLHNLPNYSIIPLPTQYNTWSRVFGHSEIMRADRSTLRIDIIILHFIHIISLCLPSVDSSKSEDHNEMMLVSSNGSMTWIPPVIYKSSCQV